MSTFRTQLLALGYLVALAVCVFVVSAFEVPPVARSITMGPPIVMLAGLTWSVAAICRTTIAAALWVAFAGFAASMLIAWETWEHLGVAAPLVPLISGWVANRGAAPVVVAADQVRRAA